MSSPTPDKPNPEPQFWTSPFEELLSETAATPRGLGTGAVHQPNPLFGTPGPDAAFWEGQQRLPDDCAIKCQQFILEQFTGRHVDETLLVREAVEHGWYSPGQGTQPSDVGNLLELHGVGVTRYEHASQFHLAMELAKGHKVIVGVESGRLWHHEPILDNLRALLGIPGTADHAVVVSGIDTSDPLHVLVQVSDPGTGQPLATYPLEQFLDAWKGSDFFMVATQDPAPANLPEMAHFDYALGHIAAIADLPYEAFLDYGSCPAAWEEMLHQYVAVHHDVHVHQHLDGFAAAEQVADNLADFLPVDVPTDPLLDHQQFGGIHHHPDPADDCQADSANQPFDDQGIHDLS